MSYHITGGISGVIFLLSILGLWSQLQLVWRRKEMCGSRALPGERPSSVLSLNQFTSSFLAFFAFFLYGASQPRFNHYLVWPRLVASLLTLAVLWEMMRDRRDQRCAIAFWGCLGLLCVSPTLLVWQAGAAKWSQIVAQTVVVVVTIILLQGYLHQVLLIRQTRSTGAVSLRLHQFFLLKDISTVAFAVTMGFAAGWPIVLLSSVSGLTKVATIWHFRWVRLLAQRTIVSP